MALSHGRSSVIAIVVATVALILLGQALFTLWIMVYAFDSPDRLAATKGPTSFCAPHFRFTVIVPARDEEAVIAETVRKIATANYPLKLLEIVVVCHEADAGTIAAARSVVTRGLADVRVETFAGLPINKPRGLNEAFARSSHEVVCVFDAEDDIHPDIFHVVNTVMIREGSGIVQSGVQLINLRDHWFSVHNCLEYFFWFKSRLHFHAKVGMIPLGGNTVFLRRDLLTRVGGWDESCLTEDADVGIRLSALGEPIRVVYNHAWVTREETPHSVAALIKQRTRWHQGFLQVLGKGDWRRLPGWRRRGLAIMTLGQPLLDAALLLSLPLIIIGGFFMKLPVPVALLSYLPLYAVVLQIVANMVGAWMFAREFNHGRPIGLILRLPLTYLPYQWMLSYSAVRAVARQITGLTNWEKTAHLGAHRGAQALGSPVSPSQLTPAAPKVSAQLSPEFAMNALPAPPSRSAE